MLLWKHPLFEGVTHWQQPVCCSWWISVIFIRSISVPFTCWISVACVIFNCCGFCLFGAWPSFCDMTGRGTRLWCAHLTTIQHCTPQIVRRKNLKTLMVKSEINHITLGPRCLIQIFVAEGIFRHLHKDCLQTSQELQMLSSVTLSTYMYITISAISSPILWVAALCMC